MGGRAAGALAIGLVSLSASAGAPLVLPTDPPPASLGATGDLSRATAVALSSDEESATAAFLAGRDDEDSRIVVVLRGAAPFDAFVKGRVISLRFASAGGTVVGLAERFDRRGRRSAALVVLEPESDRRPREIALPPTATSLDVLASEETLFVAAEDEIRSFEAASLRSGFLYSVPGPNLAVAAIPGGTRLLVGRPDGVLLVDLADPQAREGLPTRERAETSGAVLEIVASPDGDRALARLRDGSILEIGLDPWTVKPTGRAGSGILWPGTPVAPPGHGGREVVDEGAANRVEHAESPGGSAPAINNLAATVEPEPPPPPPRLPTPAAPPAPLPAGQVAGRLLGPAAGEVVAVVLLGPDDLLREAARVRPREDGTWVAEGLPQGAYRAVLDGGSGRVLVSTPPFASFRVVAGERVAVSDLEVRRTLR